MEHKSLTDQIGNKCRHFSGLIDTHCSAGVAYRDVTPPGERPLRLPCLKENNCSERCQQASFLSAEEVAEHEAQIKQAIAKYLDALHAGICPECGQTVQKEVQVGRCVYAEPCGHRLFQGKAKEQAQ